MVALVVVCAGTYVFIHQGLVNFTLRDTGASPQPSAPTAAAAALAPIREIVAPSEVQSVVFSPDGRTLASGIGSTIGLWNAASGDLLRTLSGHSDPLCNGGNSPERGGRSS